ncbi:MAG: DUF3795 domain-containing protein [Proteiniphilum sp.]
MSQFSACGFICEECEAYKATQSMDMEVLTRHQANYREQFGKDISIDELLCDGCRSSGRQISFCAICEIRKCAITRGFDTCAECPDFPCRKGAFIWKEGSVSLNNLKSIKTTKP